MSTDRIESARQYLRALELYSLYFVDHSELVEAGLLDAETQMPTSKAHTFIDNTHNDERWKKVKITADSLDEAVQLADQFACEDIGLL
ncbi:hypothetical protein [Paenibacillus segetis]|uniref:Uncharacterized protein n=1 Tax=Paenibacillus segetis TaxID=1325360 RepID=A0ABQ1YAI1_9BACL|nr:hypothetical protein [Paenibacillus segetis]GGH17412.1 hypothetical protein GCM10008013_12730 [Paenibacillus segetis]